MSAEARVRLAETRHFVLDLDGTVYTGSRLHGASREFLGTLAARGLTHTFLTNNTSRSRRQYVDKLRSLGLEVCEADVCTPVASAVAALRSLDPKVVNLFVLGTEALQGDLAAAGFKVGEAAEAEPAAVVVGFDTSLTYQHLCRAAWWIKSGLPYLATHPDLVCPTEEPTVLIDCGSICAALQAATGRAPDTVLGKPDPRILTTIATEHSVPIEQVAMVGDRLMTDMVMARRAGALAVLVLTGEATAADLRELGPDSLERPDLVVDDLAELAASLV